MYMRRQMLQMLMKIERRQNGDSHGLLGDLDFS